MPITELNKRAKVEINPKNIFAPPGEGIILKQRNQAVPAEKHDFTVDELRLGIYEGSEVVGIDFESTYFYPSDAVRYNRGGLHIRLDDTEALIALREFVKRALKASDAYRQKQIEAEAMGTHYDGLQFRPEDS